MFSRLNNDIDVLGVYFKRKKVKKQLTLCSFVLQFTKREPEDTKSADSDRDVFNEKPSKEEVMAATQAEGPKRVSDSAIIHTSMGDIHIKLFPVEYVLAFLLLLFRFCCFLLSLVVAVSKTYLMLEIIIFFLFFYCLYFLTVS